MTAGASLKIWGPGENPSVGERVASSLQTTKERRAVVERRQKQKQEGERCRQGTDGGLRTLAFHSVDYKILPRKNRTGLLCPRAASGLSQLDLSPGLCQAHRTDWETATERQSSQNKTLVLIADPQLQHILSVTESP